MALTELGGGGSEGCVEGVTSLRKEARGILLYLTRW